MIRRLSFLTVFFSLTYSLNASHLMGGEITWECQGSNSYIFTLTLYSRCASAFIFWPTETITGPNGTISLSNRSVEALDEPCHDPSASYACWGPGGSATNATEVFTFKSNVVTLNGTPPATGWVFNFNTCCRNYGVTNLTSSGNQPINISSVMYPDGSGQCHDSPSFASHPRPKLLPGEFDASMMAIKPKQGDSLYYQLVSPSGNSGPIPFTTGYSATAPFPDASEDPQNGPVTFDPTSGLIGASVHSAADSGIFQYAVEVQCWRDGNLVSVITRDMGMMLVDNSAAAATNPDLYVDTTGLRPIGNDPIMSSDNRMKIGGTPGDTIHFTMQSTDPDLIVGSTGELITFSAKGFSLDSAWPGGGSNPYSSLPTIAPVAPQSSFSSRTINQVSFTWVIGAEHLTGPTNGHIFNFSFKDNGCPSVRENNLTAEIVVTKGVNISADTLFLCERDSVPLTGASTISNNYRWSPATGLSDTAAAEPWLKASASQYYYVTDPDNPSFMDSVYVQVEARAAFDLAYNNGLLTLTDSVNSGPPSWFYNNIPLNYTSDTLTPFASGFYRAAAATDHCEYFTEEVEVLLQGYFSTADTGTGELASGFMLLTDTMGMTFTIDSASVGKLSELIIPGIIDLSGKTGGDGLYLVIHDDQGQVVWSQDTVAGNFDRGYFQTSMGVQLSAGREYTLSMSGDTGYAFHYLENVQLPFRPWNDALRVTGLSKGSSATDRMLPVVLKGEQSIGVGELPQTEVKVYPNPAGDRFVVEGAERGSQLQLTTLEGKLVKMEQVSSEKTVIERNGLSRGIYLLRLTDGLHTEVRKVIFR